LKQKNVLPEKVVVEDPDKNMRNRVKSIESTIIDCLASNLDALEVDILFLAVHPPVMKEVAAQISGKLDE
jgi:pyrroline-5-carboxylate reductase